MLPKAYRLLKNEDFYQVYQKGQKYTGKYLILYVYPHEDALKIGFVASKKVGKAHERNRVKRQGRAICHQKLHDFLKGHHLVFVFRRKALFASYQALSQEITALCKKAGIL